MAGISPIRDNGERAAKRRALERWYKERGLPVPEGEIIEVLSKPRRPRFLDRLSTAREAKVKAMSEESFLTYEQRIDRLIPEAERIAYETVGPFKGGRDSALEWAHRWNEAYHAAMERLAIEKGLRRPKA